VAAGCSTLLADSPVQVCPFSAVFPFVFTTLFTTMPAATKRARATGNGGKTAVKTKKLKTTTAESDDEMDTDKMETMIHKLTGEVGQLRNNVAELKAQVEFLLSALGWTLPSATFKAASVSAAVQASTNAVDGQPGDQSDIGGEVSDQTLYTEVVRCKKSKANLQRSIRDAVVAAVYVDQQLKDNRSANLVITGFESLSQVADQSSVTSLFRDELGISADVVNCKRLGKQTEGRIQPLLVVMRSADQADQILTNAKKLRKSTNTKIKDNVYINCHMTAAQSRAAYELRCQRRDSAARKQSSSSLTQSTNGTVATVTPSVTSEASTASAKPTPAPVPAATGNKNTWPNTTAPEFKMSSKSSSSTDSTVAETALPVAGCSY